jgi:hypothetical protein
LEEVKLQGQKKFFFPGTGFIYHGETMKDIENLIFIVITQLYLL